MNELNLLKMRTLTTSLLLVFVFTMSTTFAQSKKEMRDQITALNNKVRVLEQTEADLSQAQRRVNSLETQIEQLQVTNDGLMANMNKFLEASNQQSSTIGKTLEALQHREAQIKGIRDVFSAQDSIAILMITDLKRTLGENAQIGVVKGAITIQMEQSFLYGDKDKNTKLEETAKSFLNKIAIVANKYNKLSVSVVGDAGLEPEVGGPRVTNITAAFQDEFEVAPNRLRSILNNGFSSEIKVQLHPDFNDFYLDIRDDLKSGN